MLNGIAFVIYNNMGLKNEIKKSLLAVNMLARDLKVNLPVEALLFPATVNCVINGVKTITDCIVRITKKGKLFLLGNHFDKDIPRQFTPGHYKYLYWKDAGLLIENTGFAGDGDKKNYDILVTPRLNF